MNQCRLKVIIEYARFMPNIEMTHFNNTIGYFGKDIFRAAVET